MKRKFFLLKHQKTIKANANVVPKTLPEIVCCMIFGAVPQGVAG